jgi:hypothetical protein
LKRFDPTREDANRSLLQAGADVDGAIGAWEVVRWLQGMLSRNASPALVTAARPALARKGCGRCAAAIAAGLATLTPALGCGPEKLERAVLARVSADGDLVLVDGRRLRLAGLHLSDRTIVPLRPGETIAFGVLDEPDRWSRLPAVVMVLPADGEPVWLQENLALTGRAAVRPEPALGACWPMLAAAEAKAKEKPALPTEAGRFARVEGRVARIGEGRSATLLTIFDAGGARVTGIVQKRHLRRIQQGGVDVLGLRGHIVRLRGVRGLRNPQTIAVLQAEQIEIVR